MSSQIFICDDRQTNTQTHKQNCFSIACQINSHSAEWQEIDHLQTLYTGFLIFDQFTTGNPLTRNHILPSFEGYIIVYIYTSYMP